MREWQSWDQKYELQDSGWGLFSSHGPGAEAEDLCVPLSLQKLPN